MLNIQYTDYMELVKVQYIISSFAGYLYMNPGSLSGMTHDL